MPASQLGTSWFVSCPASKHLSMGHDAWMLICVPLGGIPNTPAGWVISRRSQQGLLRHPAPGLAPLLGDMCLPPGTGSHTSRSFIGFYFQLSSRRALVDLAKLDWID